MLKIPVQGDLMLHKSDHDQVPAAIDKQQAHMEDSGNHGKQSHVESHGSQSASPAWTHRKSQLQSNGSQSTSPVRAQRLDHVFGLKSCVKQELGNRNGNALCGNSSGNRNSNAIALGGNSNGNMQRRNDNNDDDDDDGDGDCSKQRGN